MTETPDQVIAKKNFAEYRAKNYPKLSEDEAFELFAVSLILKQYGLGAGDIERGLPSGTNDGGLDGFYLFLNGNELVESDSKRLKSSQGALEGLQNAFSLDAVVVQAKKESSWNTNVFPKIESTLKAIFDIDQKPAQLRDFPLNEDIVEMASNWRKLRLKTAALAPVVNFHVYYTSFAPQVNVDNYMKTKAKQLKNWLTANLPTGSKVAVDYLGDASLVTLLRAGTDFQASLSLAKVAMRDGKSLVGFVSIKNYLKFLRRDKTATIREEMFAFNVRDYAGEKVRVNAAIGQTLENDSESIFWWLNNGITIIADKANDPMETEWILTNPLIVNGLQTSHVIHEQDLAKKITRKRMGQSVLVRVITESDPSIRESIISGTNNQTSVSGLQLHANEQKQKRIEEFLRASGWYYERRRYQYRGMKVPASRTRTIGELGQAVIAYRLLQPDTARARPSSLLGTSSGWEKVFKQDDSEELYLKALNVVEEVDLYLRGDLAKSIADDPTNARYYLTAGYSLRSSGVKKVEDFEKIPVSALKQTPSKGTLSEIHHLLYKVVKKFENEKITMDKIFKGSYLKDEFFKEITNVNSRASQ